MARKIITTTIDWQGITLSVSYEPRTWHVVAILRVFSIKPKCAALPFARDGHLFHFCDRAEVEECGGLKPFILAWLEEASKSQDWLEYQRSQTQMTLF